MSAPLTVTRVVNACTLLEVGGATVLTDPWFSERWYIHHGEPLGLAFDELPPLDAVVVSHGFVNHWDLRMLRRLPHRESVPVVVATTRMARQERAVGFRDVHRVTWGESVEVTSTLRVDAVEAQAVPLFGRNNNYLLESPGVRVLFGGEAQAVEPLVAYGADHAPVDIALLPVNGLSVPGNKKIVMDPTDAVTVASALGADVLVPSHDAHHEELWSRRVIRRTGTAADAVRLAAERTASLRIVDLPTGAPWSWASRSVDPLP